MRANDRDLIRGGHYGQRSCEPHSKAEHMAAPTNAALVKITLANAEPSTHDPKRTSAVLLLCNALLSSDDVVTCSARAATPMRRRNFIAGLASGSRRR